MNQVAVFVIPAALVLLQLLTGAKLLTDTQHAGEDTLRRDLQIGREERFASGDNPPLGTRSREYD